MSYNPETTEITFEEKELELRVEQRREKILQECYQLGSFRDKPKMAESFKEVHNEEVDLKEAKNLSSNQNHK